MVSLGIVEMAEVRMRAAMNEDDRIALFEINIPAEMLCDLHRRLRHTRRPLHSRACPIFLVMGSPTNQRSWERLQARNFSIIHAVSPGW